MSLATTDLAGGTIDLMLAVNTTFASTIESGRARQVAVTSLQPSPAFPGVPPMASVVPGYEATLWTAVYAPVGVPPALLQRLNKEVNEIGRSPELQARMKADGAIPMALTMEQARVKVRDAYTTYKRVATAKGIVID
jgi:tripartite-type tricarboxylate transporter receptor subunit TctC